MAINLNDKIHIIDEKIVTENKGSELANSGRSAVTLSDVKALIGGGGSLEEGTWTPDLGGFVDSSDIIWNRGYYTKTPEGLVTAYYNIYIDPNATLPSNPSTDFTISGLPYKESIDQQKARVHSVNKFIGSTKEVVFGRFQDFANVVTFLGFACFDSTLGAPNYDWLEVSDLDASVYGILVDGTVTYMIEA